MKAETLGEVIKYFNHQKPLNPAQKDEWMSFYIDTRRRDIDRIKAEFLKSHPGHKVLFGGHAGNGKSTELNKFISDEEIRERFFIIKFDILEKLNPNDIEIVELLLTICFQILDFAKEKKVELSNYIKGEYKKLEGFFHDKLKIATERTDTSTKEATAEVEAGAKSPFSFLKLGADFSAKMRGQTEARELVRKEYRPRLSELIDLIRNLLTDVKSKLKGKEPLIIIDGLDRTPVKPAEKLFAEDGQSFALIDNATMLLTVPISIIHSVKAPVVENAVGKIHVLKNIRLRTRDKKIDEESQNNRELMKQAILRRLEPHLIEEKALEDAVTYSGGVFRTLIELVAEASVEATVFKSNVIGEKDVAEAVKRKRIKMARPLSRSHWEILLEVDKHNSFTGEMDEKRLELLAGLFALEYINGDEWYSVNPLLDGRLEEYKKKFKEDKKHAAKKG